MNIQTVDTLPSWVLDAPLSCDAPVAQDCAAEGDRERQVRDRAIKAIADAGLFSVHIPKKFGGMELAAADYYDVVEELSYADGSTGWSLMAVASATLGASRNLGPSAIKEMFEDGRIVNIGGHVSALGKAKIVDGGYMVSGSYSFGSGSRYATWFLAAFAVEKDGEPVLQANDKPMVIVGILPRKGVRLLGNWDVMGLSGTGTYDFEITEQFMPQDFTADLDLIVSAPIGHRAWCMGVARRALDEIKKLAQSKRRFGRSTTIDQPLFQHRFSQHYAAVEAARGLIRKTTAEWEEAIALGKLDLETRARGHLAQCWATHVTCAATDFAYHASRSNGIRNYGGENVIQRCFRDIHAGTQHRQIDDNVMIDCATVLLDVPNPDVRL